MLFKNADLNGEIVDIRTEGGKFAEIGKIDGKGVDLKGLSVYPGLFDIHIHGCVGHDTMDGDALEIMSDFLLKNGTTSYLPTTMTMGMEDIKRVCDVDLSEYPTVAGFHAEGPYICKKYKGAQNEKYIKNPDIEEFRELKNVKMVTIAPELDGASEFIKKCDAVVSVGHTEADYVCAAAAIDAGARCLTHTCNAMPPILHRAPGIIGAAIDKDIYAQVICDGLHIHRSVVKMLYRTFGADRMVLISDSMRAAGMPDGEYDLGGQPITVINGVAKTQDGAIAGSTSTLFRCVKKAIEFGIPKNDAFKMASETPARLMNMKKGRIEPGYDSEMLVLDGDMNLKYVLSGEKLIEI